MVCFQLFSFQGSMSFFVFGFRRQHLISYHNSFRLSTTFFIFSNLFLKPFFKLSFSVVVFVVFSGEQDNIILFLQKMSTLFSNFFSKILHLFKKPWFFNGFSLLFFSIFFLFPILFSNYFDNSLYMPIYIFSLIIFLIYKNLPKPNNSDRFFT